jgi:RNA polymerase sigma-70 factor (ECF subfamily)
MAQGRDPNKGQAVTFPGSDLDDLMRAANRGDAAAYRTLLGRLAPVLRGFARQAFLRYGTSGEDVEDVVQETLLAMHLKRHTWVETKPLLPWVRAIAHNKLVDHMRSSTRGRHVSIDELGDSLVAEDTQSAANGLDTEIAIGKLKGRQREVVVAISLLGQSAREVAERLSMTEGAVRVVLHRALLSLSKALRSDTP